MGAKITKLANGKYQVKSKSGTDAKATSKPKAKAQVRLLGAVVHNPDFKPYK